MPDRVHTCIKKLVPNFDFFIFADETDPRHHLHLGLQDSSAGGDSKSSAGIPIPPSKPKIWSLADTAVCKTPPPSNPTSNPNPGGGGHQPQHQYQQPSQPPHSQSYLHSAAASGLGSSWAGPNFSQFVDPAMMRLRTGNMLGMGYMGLAPPPPVSQQSFSPLTAASAGSHGVSPGLNSDGLQSNNDTPPHTPPTLKNSSGPHFGGYNGLHNGYSQMSPSHNIGSGLGSAGSDHGAASGSAGSKVLMFNSAANNAAAAAAAASSFKMM